MNNVDRNAMLKSAPPDDLFTAIKGIENVLMRIDKRLKEHFPMYEETLLKPSKKEADKTEQLS